MFFHGYRRFTEIVEVLVTPDGLAAILRNLIGAGYIRLPGTDKSIRDVENGVRIRFLVSGDPACQVSSPVLVIPPGGSAENYRRHPLY